MLPYFCWGCSVIGRKDLGGLMLIGRMTGVTTTTIVHGIEETLDSGDATGGGTKYSSFRRNDLVSDFFETRGGQRAPPGKAGRIQ